MQICGSRDIIPTLIQGSSYTELGGMIPEDDPGIAPHFESLRRRIAAQGVEAWLKDLGPVPNIDGLVYLCKFAFFTGLITKSEIAAILGLDRTERRLIVKSWYDDHRKKGCGTC